jgi:hypothetical protein
VSLAGVVGAVPFGLEFVGRPEAQAMHSLLRAEKAEFEAVLGTSVEIVADASLYHQRWIIRDRGNDEEAPTLGWDPARRELTSFAGSAAEFATTLNLLHTLAWSQQTRATNTPLTDSVLAVDRVYTEVANTYPAFALRGLDWTGTRSPNAMPIWWSCTARNFCSEFSGGSPSSAMPTPRLAARPAGFILPIAPG